MHHLTVFSPHFSIVTAFILDMFMYEYTFQKKGHIDTKVELTIKNLQLGIDDETSVTFYCNPHLTSYLCINLRKRISPKES